MRPAFRTRFTYSLAQSTNETRTKCLSLMRETAQSVSVITSVLRTADPGHPSQPVYHGATLSSFTSISMFPQPLVSFSLRMPSHMADSLNRESHRDFLKSHLVINLLSASQTHLALQFSRPRENPFASTEYFLNADGIPILHGCLGAFSCALVGSIPLGDTLPHSSSESDENAPLERQGEGKGSELFLARVLRVDKGYSPELPKGDQPDDSDKVNLPLVYYRQKYVTVDTAQRLMTRCTSPSNNINKP